MTETKLQYITDADGTPVSVVVPIEVWREIEAEHETAYLLSSETMKKRLLEAKTRGGGKSLEDVRAQLGV